MANSPETITLRTVKHPLSYEGKHILANTVIAFDSRRTTYHEQQKYPMLTTGDLEEREWKLTVPLEAAVCFSAFYKYTMVDCVTQRYECHSLPRFVWGITDFIEKTDGHADSELAGERVRACDLESGLPYLMMSDHSSIPHEVLGMGTEPAYRRYCLGVLGGNGPVAITNTMEALDVFRATHVRTALYGAATAYHQPVV